MTGRSVALQGVSHGLYPDLSGTEHERVDPVVGHGHALRLPGCVHPPFCCDVSREIGLSVARRRQKRLRTECALSPRMAARAGGQKPDTTKSLYPNVADGVDGMNFISQCVASSKEGGAWRSLKHPLCRP